MPSPGFKPSRVSSSGVSSAAAPASPLATSHLLGLPTTPNLGIPVFMRDMRRRALRSRSPGLASGAGSSSTLAYRPPSLNAAAASSADGKEL